MELLIQATNDQPKILNFDKYWLELRSRIINDFEIHKYTVHYWSSFENENLELCWTVTPYMRELWIKQNYISRKNKLSSSELAEIIIIELENYNLLLENSFTKTKKVVEEVIDIRKSLNDY